MNEPASYPSAGPRLALVHREVQEQEELLIASSLLFGLMAAVAVNDAVAMTAADLVPSGQVPGRERSAWLCT